MAKGKVNMKAGRGAAKPRTCRPDRPAQASDDWRGQVLAEVRRIIHDADPEIQEEVKWVKPSNPAGVPVWSRAGIICTGETYKQTVKLTFAHGASLEDPRGLFNASLEGNTRRAIDICAGDALDAHGLRELVRAAVAENLGRQVRSSKAPLQTEYKRKRAEKNTKAVRFLSGGNPQIAKADGDAPVQAYIAALSGWKRVLAKRLDALIVRQVPAVQKAVKWNSPFYGVEGKGFFLSFHVFTRYVKVTFFKGTSLHPAPPGGTAKEARWIDIHEADLDEALMTAWVKQAAALPGWMA